MLHVNSKEHQRFLKISKNYHNPNKTSYTVLLRGNGNDVRNRFAYVHCR